VSRIARSARLSPPHLSRLVKAITGLSPSQYVIRARCDLARTQLAETSSTVEEIAYELGYRDIYFFSRQFKQVVGTAPSHYREDRYPRT